MLDMSMFREHADVLRADHDKREMPHDNIDEVIRLMKNGGRRGMMPINSGRSEMRPQEVLREEKIR